MHAKPRSLYYVFRLKNGLLCNSFFTDLSKCKNMVIKCIYNSIIFYNRRISQNFCMVLCVRDIIYYVKKSKHSKWGEKTKHLPETNVIISLQTGKFTYIRCKNFNTTQLQMGRVPKWCYTIKAGFSPLLRKKRVSSWFARHMWLKCKIICFCVYILQNTDSANNLKRTKKIHLIEV